MLNFLAALIVGLTYVAWGFWLLNRKWSSETDLDLGFYLSIIPVAAATWTALHLVGA